MSGAHFGMLVWGACWCRPSFMSVTFITLMKEALRLSQLAATGIPLSEFTLHELLLHPATCMQEFYHPIKVSNIRHIKRGQTGQD